MRHRCPVRGGETTASDGEFPRSAKAGQDCNAVPDVCYRIAAPREGKTATRGLPVRCMKAAGRSIYYLAGPGLCKRNGCDRHTGAGLKSSVGYRHCYTLRECRGVQWMWRGGGNRMIRPLCKQFKRSAMPGPVKRITPNVGGVVAPRGGLCLLR